MKEYVALDEITFTIYICQQIGDKNWIRDNRCWGWQVVIVSSINNDQSSLAGNCYLVQSGYEILQKKTISYILLHSCVMKFFLKFTNEVFKLLLLVTTQT